jgi:hypothetical protein
MVEVANDPVFGSLFTKLCHHLGFSVMHVMQNLYNPGLQMRNSGRNLSHLIMFDCVREGRMIKTLAGEIYPDNPQILLQAYNLATESSHGYLLIDFRPNIPSKLRLRSGLLKVASFSFLCSV